MKPLGLLGLLAVTGCSLAPGTARADTPAPGGEKSGWTNKPPIRFPISDKPADPWAGVKGDKPITFEDEDSEVSSRWELKKQDIECTAARDHCLPSIAWLWVTQLRPTQLAQVVAFTAYGPRTPNGLRWGKINPDAYIAYRTVPATKHNLVPGAIAFAYPQPYPKELTEVYVDWRYGKVEKVDWELGFVFLEGDGEPRILTGTRVAVISYDGKQLKILGDKKRDQLAVSPKDLILP